MLFLCTEYELEQLGKQGFKWSDLNSFWIHFYQGTPNLVALLNWNNYGRWWQKPIERKQNMCSCFPLFPVQLKNCTSQNVPLLARFWGNCIPRIYQVPLFFPPLWVPENIIPKMPGLNWGRRERPDPVINFLPFNFPISLSLCFWSEKQRDWVGQGREGWEKVRREYNDWVAMVFSAPEELEFQF